MISRVNEPRQLYGLGSFVKKIGKGIKKVAKSPIGKAALIGGGLWGLNNFGPLQGKLGSMLGTGWNKFKGMGLGKQALLGAGVLGTTLPFLAGEEEEEIIETPWEETSGSIANIRQMARDRHPSLMFLPKSDYVQQGFFTGAKDGGIIGLANGGNPAEAQAEQMLKMEYQKYRNQGGTMSYQQFKMAVLQQAQAQGPMAQGQPQMAQPQMAAKGGRIGYNRGRVVNPGGYAGVELEPYWKRYQPDLSDRHLNQISDGRIISPPRGDISGILEFMKMMAKTKNKAEGGRIGKEEGGLMDLGGMEKDYRQDGGFVGIGRKERADDVPARLSKNEFVFTADAVRNAGGGDIDAGAEVMDNMMKHLESGGQISEESQGGGGEEMISEEEMIQAPDGAQEMYEQQAMLQSRMA